MYNGSNVLAFIGHIQLILIAGKCIEVFHIKVFFLNIRLRETQALPMLPKSKYLAKLQCEYKNPNFLKVENYVEC